LQAASFTAHAARAPKPYRIAAGPFIKKQVSEAKVSTTVRFSLEGLTVWVSYLDPERRAAAVKAIEPGGGDPFAPPPGRSERFNAFLVQFENETAFDVSFQPGNVVLITDRNEQQFPIDGADIYLQAERARLPDPQGVMNRTAALIFDSSTTIPSGTRFERLIVFSTFPEKWKEFRLLFSYLQIGAETHSLSFRYHKEFLED